MINIKDYDSGFLKLHKNIAIYYIGYITKKDEYKIKSVNLLYLIVGEMDGFFLKRKRD